MLSDLVAISAGWKPLPRLMTKDNSTRFTVFDEIRVLHCIRAEFYETFAGSRYGVKSIVYPKPKKIEDVVSSLVLGFVSTS